MTWPRATGCRALTRIRLWCPDTLARPLAWQVVLVRRRGGCLLAGGRLPITGGAHRSPLLRDRVAFPLGRVACDRQCLLGVGRLDAQPVVPVDRLLLVADDEAGVADRGVELL